MEIKKEHWIIIGIVIILLVIIVWYTRRGAANGNGNGNGGPGNGGAGNGGANLINVGTGDYIEVRSPENGNIFLTYYDHLDNSSYAGANIYPSLTNPTFGTVVPFFLDLWYSQGRLTQTQFDNALMQLQNLGH